MAEAPAEPLVTNASDLERLVAHLRDSARFAFDTEFVSEDTFEPVLCLIQVATRERHVVVDPLAVGDLTAFWDVVNDPEIEVVMHAAGEDLRIGRIRSGRLPERVVDVQVAAALVGFGYPLSLGNLVSQTLGVSLAGGETRTDWRRRPLSAGQVRYALDDVAYLLEVADTLNARLDALDRREWAEIEYRSLIESVRARDDEDRWRRLSGLQQLSRRGLEVARRLSEWRRDDSRRANRPLRQVLRDDLLVAIAKRQPASRRDLEALRDFNRPHLLARSNEILTLIADAQNVSPEDLPEHAERHEDGPGLAMVVSLMNATLNQCATQKKVATSLVGSSADLKDLIRWHVSGRPEARRPALLSGWRGEVCGQTLLDVLTGRRALRIVDPEAEVPVALDPIEDEDDATNS
ncbi:MAG: ribonuclease [Planctomycetota bacterium]|nr:ribonuclease [Planctomycetota bacterium]